MKWRRILPVMCALAAVCVTLFSFEANAAPPRRPAAKKPALKLPPLKTPADKRRFLEVIRRSMPTRKVASSVGYDSEDLDKALFRGIGEDEKAYAPVISDTQFLRRVTLDLTGQLPSPRELKAFAASRQPDKRAAKIDELLETEAYARKWARYWTDVVFHESTANRNRVDPKAMENWMTKQFQSNASWDKIVAEMVSAMPKRNKAVRNAYGQDYGPNNFVLAYNNKPEEVASQTARIFMGISIQCAECHDHPFDRWKREQFHELSAFFAPGKYYMTDEDDPTKKERVQPVFLLNEKPPENLSADARRVAVAAYLIYNPDNYWFARAYVNRVWNELLGDGFYSVDSLGPDAECAHKLIVNRIASVFRYKDFDPKWVFRLIMNTETYQRDIRAVGSDTKLFTAVRPSRFRPDQVRAAIENIAGKNANLAKSIERTFDVNPSVPQRDLEGSIQQALLMMNNGTLQSQLVKSELRKRLQAERDNETMLNELYLNVLGRTPTAAEKTRNTAYIRKVGNRSEAIEDLIWVLTNSTEFITKR